MNKKLVGILGCALAVATLVSCGNDSSSSSSSSVKEPVTTEEKVEAASKMTLKELEDASKKEFEGATDTFKVVGLTSVLKSAAATFASKYDWVKYTKGGATGDNTYVKNDYKDYALLKALEVAEDSYFADYALVQDVRSIADYDGELLFNYIPSDWQALGLTEADTKQPLKGVAFNKLFWTNKNFKTINGFNLHNIWQMTGSAQKAGKTDYISNVSFQSPATEQINMSFLLSCYADNNQERIAAAYKKYFGTDWAKSGSYTTAGEQWVAEFIANIARWHSSDGTAMKKTQLESDWKAGYVYYGAFAKMKDAVGEHYIIAGQDSDEILKDLVIASGDNAGKINAMATVKWDWEIDGFNGFYYNMCSQVCNNAKFPYTACLFGRTLLTLDAYSDAIYNKSTPNEAGEKANQYGYYFPASNSITYAAGDWTRDVHTAKELVEDYSFLKSIRVSRVNEILTMMGANTKAK